MVVNPAFWVIEHLEDYNTEYLRDLYRRIDRELTRRGK